MSTISETPIWYSRDLHAATVARANVRDPKILDRLQKLGISLKELRSQYTTAKTDVVHKGYDHRTGGDTRRRLREKLKKA